MPRLFKQIADSILDAQDLRRERVHAQFISDLQRLAEVLVGLSDIDIGAFGVEDGAAEFLGDGLGEVMVWFYNDVLVVPRDVDDGEARDEEDAARSG